MTDRKSLAMTRLSICCTIFSLLGVMVVFELGVNTEWSTLLKFMAVSMLVMLFVTYPFAFILTGLWQFTHKSVSELDERELKLAGKSLRIAYAIFTVIVLIVLYVFAVFDIRLSVVLAAGLLLFAHILPGTVLAFSEKDLQL